jgi:multidrug resistance efflux pump
LARTTAAELDLARSVIRAPVSGHVVSLGVSAPNDTIDPGATVAEIATEARHDLAGHTAEPLLRTMHRMLRSLYQENAA